MIAISQLRMRRLLLAQGVTLAFRMWLFPWLTYAVIGFIVAALGMMLITPEHRTEVTTTVGLALAISLIGIVLTRRHASTAVAGAAYLNE